MVSAAWHVAKCGLLIRLRVTPNASKNLITGVYKNGNGLMSLKVSATAQPEKGKANNAVIAILSKAFGTSKSVYKVVSGETDRNKTVLVDGKVEEIKTWLLPKIEEIEHG